MQDRISMPPLLRSKCPLCGFRFVTGEPLVELGDTIVHAKCTPTRKATT